MSLYYSIEESFRCLRSRKEGKYRHQHGRYDIDYVGLRAQRKHATGNH